MKISICVTYYNQKEFAEQSLSSVLSIDFPCDFEILCGDDGSTDGTLDIIKQYTQKYPNNIKYFVMDRNEVQKSINRASLNRLNLAKNATGDYIMFLDGDDYYCDTQFIKESLQIFQNNPKVIACAFGFKYLYQNNSEEKPSHNIPSGLINPQTYIKNGLYTPSGACVFKNILDINRLDMLHKINNFDDIAITIYILQFGDLYYIDKTIYTYRQTNNSLWNTLTDCEKNIINAFDYKLISTIAPIYKNEILKRNIGAIKYLYYNRKHIKDLLTTKYNHYLYLATRNNDIFIKNILEWDNLNIILKIKIAAQWRIIKLTLWIYDKIFRFI